MVVFTRITFDEMAIVAQELGIGVLEKFEDVEAGAENSSFKAYTSKGKWMVSLIERYHSEAHANWQAHLMHYLKQANIPVPAPVLAKDGSIPFTKGKPLFVVPYIDGYHVNISNTVSDTALIDACAEAGEVLGNLHLAGETFPEQFNGWISASSIFAEWDRLKKAWEGSVPFHAQATADIAYVWAEGNKRLDSLKKQWSLSSGSLASIPKCAIHGDYFPDNVIFTKEKVSGVIDFPYCCTELAIYDLAIAITAWGFDQNIDWHQERIESLIKGYAKARGIQQEERMVLNLLCQFASARFFVTRLGNLFEARKAGYHPKDPADYLKRLQFFEDQQSNSIFKAI